MPAALERKLKREATKEGLKGKHKNAYVYGTLRKTGWKPSTQMSQPKRLIQLNSMLDNVINLDQYDPRAGQRAFLGPGLTIAIHGKKGQKFKGAVRSEGRSLWETTKGAGAGAGIGAGLGAGVGAALALRKGNLSSLGTLKRYAGLGASVGASTGTTAGATIGQARGVFGKRADQIYRKSTGQLSAKLDRILRFDYRDDDEDQPRPNKTLGSAVRAGALATGVGAGLYGIGAMAKKNASAAPIKGAGLHVPIPIKNTGGLGLNLTQTAQKAGTDISNIGRGGVNEIAGTIGRGYNVATQAAKAAAPKIGAAISQAPSAIAALYGKLKGLARLSEKTGDLIEFKGKPIEPLNPKNKGKLTETEKKTGKSAEELKHSKNPKTRERANFAVNAKHWKHKGRRKSRAAALSSVLDSIIAFKAIDLGYTYGDNYPSEVGSMGVGTDAKHYPSLYIDRLDKEPKLPLSGTAKVKYKLRGKTSRTDGEGKTKHSADIEIHSIDPIEEEEKPREGGKAKLIGMSEDGGSIQGATGAPSALQSLRRKLFKRKKTDQGTNGMVPGDSPGSTSELIDPEDLLEFGNTKRLHAIAAAVGLLAGGAISHPKVLKALEHLRGAGKVTQEAASHVAPAEAPFQVQWQRRHVGVPKKEFSTLSRNLDSILEFRQPFTSSFIDLLRSRKAVAPAVAVSASRARTVWPKLGQLIKPKTNLPAKGWYAGRSIDAGQALNTKLDKIIAFGDPRPRNPLGEFSGQNESGVDPNAVNIVYNQPQKKLHQGAIEGAAAGLGAGIGGATGAGAIKSLFSKLKKVKK